MEPERICTPGLFCRSDQPDGLDDVRPRLVPCPGLITHAPTSFDTRILTDFTDAIAKDWGGKPFVDLQKGWKYALDKYPEVDPDRAVAAGASWGGYAIK